MEAIPLEEVEEAWEALAETTDISKIVPITYMNSSAALKAFAGDWVDCDGKNSAPTCAARFA